MPAKPSTSNFASALLLAICAPLLFASGAAAADSNNHPKDGAPEGDDYCQWRLAPPRSGFVPANPDFEPESLPGCDRVMT